MFPEFVASSATTSGALSLAPRITLGNLAATLERLSEAGARDFYEGRIAEQLVDEARANVAALVGANPKEIIWTSGATESNNLALKGAARFHADRGRHLVTSRTEHKAVLDSCKRMEQEGVPTQTRVLVARYLLRGAFESSPKPTRRPRRAPR